MPPTPQEPTSGDAALQVLTNPELFRPIVSWSAGWPGLVVHTLLQSKRDRPRSDKSNDAAARLLRDGDVRTLTLASEARWYVNGELAQFTFTDVGLALQSGNGDAVRLALEATPRSPINPDRFYWLWSIAITHCPGHCRVLEVLKEHAPPELVGRRCKFSADYMLQIRHIAVAQWFVDTYGSTSLPAKLLEIALRTENAGLFYFLLKIEGQDLAFLKNEHEDVDTQLIHLLLRLHRGKKVNTSKMVNLLARCDDEDLLQLVLPDIADRCDESRINDARAQLLRKQEAKKLQVKSEKAQAWNCEDFSLERQAKGRVRRIVDRVSRWFKGSSSS